MTIILKNSLESGNQIYFLSITYLKITQGSNETDSDTPIH